MASLLGKAVRTALAPRNLVAGPPDFAGRPGGSFFAPSDSGDRAAQMAAYGEVGTLFSIVSRLATATSKVEWALYRKAASGLAEDRQAVTSHPALNVWHRPNNFYTRNRFVETVQQHMDLTGEQWWVLVRDQRIPSLGPVEIWPVRPDRMTPVPDRDRFIAGYIYTSPTGEKIPLDVADVVFVPMPNPLDPYRGLGPVQALMIEIDSARYTAQWNRNFFLNSAQPGGVIEVAGDLSDDEYKKMVEHWREQHKGVNAAHRVAVLENGAKFTSTAFSQKDMQFVQLRQVSRDALREAFGIPKFALGDVDDVNRATADASSAFFAEHLTEPRLDRIREALNFQFLPMFYPGGWRTVDVEFDYATPVPPDLDREAASRAAAVGAATALIDRGTEPAATFEAFGLPVLPMAAAQVEPSQVAVPTAADEVARQAAVAAQLVSATGTVVALDESRAALARAGWPIDPFRTDVAPDPAPAATPAPDPSADAGPAQDTGVAAADAPPGTAVPGVDARRRPPRIVNMIGAPVLDVRAGLVPVGGAWRTLNAVEEDAGLDPERIQAQWERRLAALLRDWDQATGEQRDRLADQIRAAVNNNDPGALANLVVSSSDLAGILLDALTEMSGDAADQVVAEAQAQGVSIEPAAPDGHALSVVAATTASLLIGSLANAAGREALRWLGYGRTGDEVAKATTEHLAGLSDAFTRANLGHALTRAQNMARAATLERAVGVVKVKFYASEVLDGNTCKPCAKIDGKQLPSADAMILAYGGGPYLYCLGTIRCRGMAIGVFQS